MMKLITAEHGDCMRMHETPNMHGIVGQSQEDTGAGGEPGWISGVPFGSG